MSAFGAGSSAKPQFSVDCTARAIIHGTLDDQSQQPASLLIYDFSFLAFRSTRLKSANISFEFKDKESQETPVVYRIAPYLKHTTMPSTEVHRQAIEAGVSGNAGFGPAAITPNISASNSREKTMEYQVEVIGENPSDDYGRRFRAQWSLNENESQKRGIPTFLRVCILLEREHDRQFLMRPTVEATANTATRISSLFAARTQDDPVEYDPSLDPYAKGIDGTAIDRWNLEAADIDGLWDCTFHREFSRGVKVS